jgi:Erv1 / Alr family
MSTFVQPRGFKYLPEVWGPHFWFVIHTVAHSYPAYANDVTKRKYYDFIHNLPLFIPDEKIGNKFGQLLDRYPVTPYLDKRESFIRWTNFIHNKINLHLGKEEMSLYDATKSYYAKYKPQQHTFFGETYAKKYLVYGNFAIILLLGVAVVMTYDSQ